MSEQLDAVSFWSAAFTFEAGGACRNKAAA